MVHFGSIIIGNKCSMKEWHNWSKNEHNWEALVYTKVNKNVPSE